MMPPYAEYHSNFTVSVMIICSGTKSPMCLSKVILFQSALIKFKELRILCHDHSWSKSGVISEPVNY